MKIKQWKRTVVMKKSLRSAYISEQKTKSVYFKLRPLPPLSYATAEYCLYTFLFLGSEGGMAWCVPAGICLLHVYQVVIYTMILYKDLYFIYHHVHYGKKKDVLYIRKVHYMNNIYTKLRYSLPSLCEIEINRKSINRSAPILK